MCLFKCKKEATEILEIVKAIKAEVREILFLLTPHTRKIGIQFTGEPLMNSVVLTVGQSTTASIVPLEADGTTQTPGAFVSVQTLLITDPGITVTPNADGTATVAGTAATAGAISGTATATVTDTDGTSSNFSVSFTVTVNAPTQHTAGIAVSFTKPA